MTKQQKEDIDFNYLKSMTITLYKNGMISKLEHDNIIKSLERDYKIYDEAV